MANCDFSKFVCQNVCFNDQVGAHVTSTAAIAEHFSLFNLFRANLLQLLHSTDLEWEDVWYQT